MTIALSISSRGTITLPAAIRERLRLDNDHTLLLIEERPDGVFLHPAVPVPVRDLSADQIKKWIAQDEADAASVKIIKP